ncbi:MAG: MerR family transcriptional regulator [Thermodesulfobacteriota bacterium]
MSLTIGELARHAGLTIRTLRHYDQIGLLKPSGRSNAGYRLYDADDTARLHHILALKELGLPLGDIRATLDANRPSPRAIIARRIRDLDARIAEATALRDRLARLDARLASGGEARLDDWLGLLERMRLYEKYLSPEELRLLRQRHDAAGPERAAAMKALLCDIREAMARGSAPETPEAGRLALALMRHVLDLTGGDLETTRKLRLMRQKERRALELFGLDATALNWLSTALGAARRAMRDRCLDAAERDDLLARLRAHGRDWPPLLRLWREALNAGTRPDDPALAPLAEGLEALFATTSPGGDPQCGLRLLDTLTSEPELPASLGLTPDLLAFMRQAMDARRRLQPRESP